MLSIRLLISSAFPDNNDNKSLYMQAWQGITSDPTSPHFIKKIAAGPLESDDGKYMIGKSWTDITS